MPPRTVEYWVRRFECRGLAGLREGARPGQPSPGGPGANGPGAGRGAGHAGRGGVERQSVGRQDIGRPRAPVGGDLRSRQCRNLLHQWEFRYRKSCLLTARTDPEGQAAHFLLHVGWPSHVRSFLPTRDELRAAPSRSASEGNARFICYACGGRNWGCSPRVWVCGNFLLTRGLVCVFSRSLFCVPITGRDWWELMFHLGR